VAAGDVRPPVLLEVRQRRQDANVHSVAEEHVRLEGGIRAEPGLDEPRDPLPEGRGQLRLVDAEPARQAAAGGQDVHDHGEGARPHLLEVHHRAAGKPLRLHDHRRRLVDRVDRLPDAQHLLGTVALQRGEEGAQLLGRRHGDCSPWRACRRIGLQESIAQSVRPSQTARGSV